MFDNYSYKLFNDLPRLPDLNIEETRRSLSRAYIYSIKMKLGLIHEEFKSVQLESLSEEELEKIEEEIDEGDPTLFNELYFELRRLGDTLESNAIFDKNEDGNSIKAAAFVSAESLSLLATLITSDDLNYEEESLLSNEIIYTRAEAAMLFLIAGYDANAQTEINEVAKYINKATDERIRDNLIKIEEWFLSNLVALLTNKLWSLEREKPMFENNDKRKSLSHLIKENKVKMFSSIGDSIIYYIDWLMGDNEEGFTFAIEELVKINQSAYKNKYALFPEVYHFSKVLMEMIKRTSSRSLFHNTPLSLNNELEFTSYLKGRVKGNSMLNSRPFIWESAQEFISQCLPGPNKNVIVNQPTGSGKSFIAELAATHSLSNGWVLYLAPTNALVHQIKKDLKKSLQFYGSVDIKTFVGGDEYTKLEGEFIEEIDDPQKFVAVMTPEKCAMSLRITPEIFKNCSLCIFDECHLLGEGSRGATVDLVLGQIISINSNIKFVLMSAMLSNPKDISDWLDNVTSSESQISSVLWKPTRSIRGAVGVEYASFKEARDNAEAKLNSLPDHRRNVDFNPKLSILYSLSGIWRQNYNDYLLMDTDFPANYVLSRRKVHESWIKEVNAKSWVNKTSRTLGIELATKGIPTIVFIPSNRHYPFTLGRNITLEQYEIDLSNLERSFLLLAEKELGIESEVKELLLKGVGVHTSFMLDTEKEAVENAFKGQNVKLLFATGTLAQGLNLPSVAVVIAGTRIGDAREANTPEALTRSKALILNAIGRAGRAGFSNQSLSIIVPNEPVIFKKENIDIDRALSEINVLQENDASIIVSSPLGKFLIDIMRDAIQEDRASLQELTIMSMLTSNNEQDDETNKNTLSKTYAASIMKQRINNEELIKVTNKITNIKNEFIKNANAPDWSIDVARKSGFDFFTTNSFIKIILDIIPDKNGVLEWDIRNWTILLFKGMERLPPYFLQRLLPQSITQKTTFINMMAQSAANKINESNLFWTKPDHWDMYWNEFLNITWLYMEGKSYAEIAKYYLNIDGEVDSSRSAGKPIPDTLSLVKRQIEEISSYAGLLVAVLEEVLFKDEPLPFSLNVLPLAIKNGLKDHHTFYWYSYGMRNRMVAHKLANALPLGEFIDEDTSRRKVIQLKRLWLRNQIDINNLSSEEQEILEAASMVVKNS
ncbi:DEAD/DEAH box helicase [Alkalibacillus aidingensis]|uniref:DEAD/DEAH box helicase n=1 Tax=Alkalibacillus aidingensis TaxID=2747607 RepID=UPI001660EEF5|nr:DEAD/DEAH box helicase [Alkalibacillus aidingensis]